MRRPIVSWGIMFFFGFLLMALPATLHAQQGMPAEGWTPQAWLARSGAQVSQETASQLAVCVGLVVREQV